MKDFLITAAAAALYAAFNIGLILLCFKFKGYL